MKLKITVGAATDASFNAVFKSIVDAQKSAQKLIDGEERSSARRSKRTLEEKLEAQKAHYKSLQAANVARLKNEVEAERNAARQKQRENISAADRTAREVSRIQEKALQQAAHKNAMRQVGGGGGGFGEFMFGSGMGGGGKRDLPYRMGYWASRNFSPITPMLSFAHRAASSLVRGAGVNFDIGGMVGQNVANQKLATDIANSAYMPNDETGRNSRRVSGDEVYGIAKQAADANAMDRGSALTGLQAFVGKTGDLATGREIIGDMGKLARATGTDFQDMVSAAGEVANGLGNVEDKGSKVSAVMRAIAGQGKLGAVEIRDLANQMSKLASRAGEIRGDRVANIEMMGVLAQGARAGGGAANAAQATTSVGAFMDVFGKGARLKAWHNMRRDGKGGGIPTHDEHNALRSPQELIMDALSHTGGNTKKMNDLVGSAFARRSTRHFEKIYNATEGDNSTKLKAVAAEFMRMKKASMGEGEIGESFRRSMGTTEAKVQMFQNKLQDTVDKMTVSFLPALEKLEPAALKIVDAFGNVTTWLAANPFEIIPLALGAAIAKAGIEQTLRVGIENVMRTIMGQSGPGFGGGAGVVGNAAALATIAALTVTTLYVGMAMIDAMDFNTKGKKSVEADIGADNADSMLRGAIRQHKVHQADIDDAKTQLEKVNDQIQSEAKAPGWFEQFFKSGAKLWDEKGVKAGEEEAAKRRIKLAEDQVRLLNAIKLAVQDMKAHPEEKPAPKPNEKSRTPSSVHEN